jgi:hypothetical protein
VSLGEEFPKFRRHFFPLKRRTLPVELHSITSQQTNAVLTFIYAHKHQGGRLGRPIGQVGANNDEFAPHVDFRGLTVDLQEVGTVLKHFSKCKA